MNEDWMNLVFCYHPTGSRYICSPPVMNTDEDWVCLSKNYINDYKNLIKIGFKIGGSYNEESPFLSLKRDITNLIIVKNVHEYNNWVIASRLAKRFNLLDKADRIALFEAVVRRNVNYEYYEEKPEDWL